MGLVILGIQTAGGLVVPDDELLFCSACHKPYAAPRSAGTKDVECSHCGKRMHVVTIQPAGETGRTS